MKMFLFADHLKSFLSTTSRESRILIIKQFHGFRKLNHFSELQNDALMHREG